MSWEGKPNYRFEVPIFLEDAGHELAGKVQIPCAQ